MDPNEWKHEMNRMLDAFASQAENSLGKINRCFETLDLPFDDDFRKYYLEVSNQRLDICFKTVLFSKGRGNQTENNANHLSATKNQSLNSVKNEHDDDLIEICDSDDGNCSDTESKNTTDSIHDRMRIQTLDSMQHSTRTGCGNDAEPSPGAELNRGNKGNDSGAMIEVYDSNDEEQQFETQTNTGVNEIGAADLDNENEVKSLMKVESNGTNAMELANVPMIEFDPHEKNSDVAAVSGTGESSETHQTNRSTNIERNKLEQSSAKRKGFKCDQCSLVLIDSYNLKRHQTVHANEILIGEKAYSNGIFKCTLCVRKFFNVNHLSRHMQAHKNGQHLHYCARCFCQFSQKAKKEQHERHCGGHHYQCHLCKVYITRKISHLQCHMRTHSGAKPFQCMVCNMYFQQKGNLTVHLNRTHSRNRP